MPMHRIRGPKTLILHYLLISPVFAYFLILVLMMFEGDATLYTAALLTQQNMLRAELVIPLAIMGIFLGDVICFEIGRRLSPASRIRTYLDKLTERFDDHLTDHPFRTMFISKFAYGMGHFAIIRIGTIDGISLKEFIKRDIMVSLPWFIIVWTLGYGTGAILIHLRRYLHYAEVAIAIGVLLLIGLQYIFTYEAKKISHRRDTR